MKSYLLTWNPRLYPWNDMHEALADVRANGVHDGNWSCRTRQIEAEDRVFLMRQVEEPRGIVASGFATSDAYLGKHWNKKKAHTRITYVDVRFDTILDPKTEGVLPLSELSGKHLSTVHWKTQSSGIEINAAAASDLERKWKAYRSGIRASSLPLPDEVEPNNSYSEGAVRTVVVNAYERCPEARRECIAHYGPTCIVCKFNFEQVYGEIGEGYIHVHHIIPISRIGHDYEIDPISDLVPVCPNCHAMLHSGLEVLDIKHLRKVIQKQRRPKTRN